MIINSTGTKITNRKSFLNPAQLFIVSFLVLIFTGTLLLMLPYVTRNGISFIDALFTSTSAVCVTGLIVVDTSTYFTTVGQTIIMLLIQSGGLGILTFASYFSYFFKGGSSYENQIALSVMTNSEKIGDVFTTVKRILLITFFVETIGAFFIYLSLALDIDRREQDKSYYNIFINTCGHRSDFYKGVQQRAFWSFRYRENYHRFVCCYYSANDGI